MESESGSGISGAVFRLISTVLRMSGAVGNFVEERAASIRATWKEELHRIASTLIYALVAAFFICSAAAWGAFALMLAFWDTHRVLVASLLAGGFLLMSVAVVLLLRRGTR
jgi:hypothetical protein